MPTDISKTLNDLNVRLFTTPAPGYMRKHADRKMTPAVETIQQAVENNFPMRPNAPAEGKKKSLK